MKLFRIFFVVCILSLSACTKYYSHAFLVKPTETLSQQEVKEVFVKFKTYLISEGMTEITAQEYKSQDSAVFQLGSGKSGLLRESFNEYLELKYSEEKGFVLVITRVISHPIDFSDEYISDFKTKTIKLIYEATSKNVKLQVIENANP